MNVYFLTAPPPLCSTIEHAVKIYVRGCIDRPACMELTIGCEKREETFMARLWGSQGATGALVYL